jgi:zinc protease
MKSQASGHRPVFLFRPEALLALAFMAFVLFLCSLTSSAQKPAKPGSVKARQVRVFPTNLVTLPSASPLYQIEVMVRAGSAQDAIGKEGTANLVARALIEGGFGDPKNPVTKEKLADITRPWGDAALPQVRVDKESTTFTMTVPREALTQFVARVLKPMFTQPLWMQPELDRLRREALTDIQSGLRFEDEESLGLLSLDNWVFAQTPLDHLATGTVKGLQAVTRDDLASFYSSCYTRGNMYMASSINDPAQLEEVVQSFPGGEMAPRTQIITNAEPGRKVLIITQPNAIATGLHLGFPISLNRNRDDYWPLFVANVFLGAHRDSFGRLYLEIRDDRGYNYGDYSYIEYQPLRQVFLFPPPNTPRDQQYFSLWIRPVGHQYTHFILKVMTAELDRFIKEGLTPGQVAEAKVKARVLYLNYAENVSRQVGYRLDDMFYGMKDHGYLQEMLARIDAVTPEQANAAIKKYLQIQNLKYVIVTNESVGDKLADDIANGTNVTAKTMAEYHISEPVPPEKQKMLAQDEQWKAYPLNISRSHIQVVKAEQMFETAGEPGGSPLAATHQ